MLNREEFVKIIDSKLKLIRHEKQFTQDKMAEIIGISKKTLVQIEKERSSIGWSGAVCVCTIFVDSEILQMLFGGDVQDIIRSLAFRNYEVDYDSTLGGKVWWMDIKINTKYRIQQNIITNHYRILNNNDKRVCSSFDDEFIKSRYNELVKVEEENDN